MNEHCVSWAEDVRARACVCTCTQTQFLLWWGFDLKAAGKLRTNFKAIHMHLSALSSSLICCSLLCGADCFNRWWRFYFVPGKGCHIMSPKPHCLYLRGGIQTSVIFMPLTKKVTDRKISQTLFCTFSIWSLWWHPCACAWSTGTHFRLTSDDLFARSEGGATVVMETTANCRELGSQGHLRQININYCHCQNRETKVLHYKSKLEIVIWI